MYTNGSSYSGSFANDKRNGQGTMSYGTAHLGQSAGKKKREGLVSYKGNWKDGVKHGNGTEIYRFGQYSGKYEGEFQNGVKHGEGSLTADDGSSYEGSWKNGMKEGYGVEVTIDQDADQN